MYVVSIVRADGESTTLSWTKRPKQIRWGLVTLHMVHTASGIDHGLPLAYVRRCPTRVLADHDQPICAVFRILAAEHSDMHVRSSGPQTSGP